ncbi:MAG TPA: hypothetical protein VH370_11915 [Humisphaera sp.]|jgi:hypothetical protein|nr:hypothetical protein [Humisphaera sp.]
MQTFVQQLESRTLFSATADTLTADLSTIQADATAVRTALMNSAAAYAPDLAKLEIDLKAAGGPANLALAKKMKHDAVKTFGILLVATNRVLGTLNAGTVRSAAHGLQLIAKSTAHAIAKVEIDIAKLNALTTITNIKVNTALASNKVAADITAASANNPTNDTITADVNQLTTDQGTFTTFLNAAHTIVTDVGTLATDLGTLVA